MEVCQTNFTAKKTVELFFDIVVKYHGYPKSIVFDRDTIFLSNFWNSLMEVSGTKLKHSTAYRPQTDGKTEVVNQELEQYLRAMVMFNPKKWTSMLGWAEFCHNTSYNSSIKMPPYKALYGKEPPSICLGTTSNDLVDMELGNRDALLRDLKENLVAAKLRMEYHANKKRRELEF